jgi:hypothetical protein
MPTFPFTDEYGDRWVDNLGYEHGLAAPGRCCVCQNLTKRIDIQLHDYFCKRPECEKVLRNGN